MQTSYAKAVENLGLERGLAGSSAKHKDIRKLYAELNRAKADIPQPRENETAAQYYQRAIQELETMRLSIEREKKQKEVEQQRKLDEYRIKYINETKVEKDKLVAEFNSIRTAIGKIKLELGMSSTEELDSEYIKDLIQRDNDYINYLNYLEENNPELYQEKIQQERQTVDEIEEYKERMKAHSSDGLMFDDFDKDLR
jgi:hypothetical protein